MVVFSFSKNWGIYLYFLFKGFLLPISSSRTKISVMIGGRANYFINSFFGRNALSLEFSLHAISLNNDLGIFL